LKKLIVIIVSCCLLLNMIGYHIIFFMRKAEIRAEMMRTIRQQRNAALENDFVFSLNGAPSALQPHWEDEDEFSLDGKMYDVIEKKISGHQLLVRCLADGKETDLLQLSGDHWKDNDRSNKIANELFQILQTLFCHGKSGEVVLHKPVPCNSHFLLGDLPPGTKRITTPPPQPV